MTTLQAAQALCPNAGLNENSTNRDIIMAILDVDDFAKMYPKIIEVIKNSEEGRELAARATAQNVKPEDFRRGVMLLSFGSYIKAKMMALRELRDNG